MPHDPGFINSLAPLSADQVVNTDDGIVDKNVAKNGLISEFNSRNNTFSTDYTKYVKLAIQQIAQRERPFGQVVQLTENRDEMYSIPSSWDDFITRYRRYVETTQIDSAIAADVGFANTIRVTPSILPVRTGVAFDRFVDGFSGFVSVNDQYNVLADGNDWEILGKGKTAVEQRTDLGNFFVEAFNHFIQSHQASGFNGVNNNTVHDHNSLFDEFYKFLSVTATITKSHATLNSQNLNSFEGAYESIVSPNTSAEFETLLIAFVQDKRTNEGYFLPSHFYNDWVIEMDELEIVRAKERAEKRINEIFGNVDGQGALLLEIFDCLSEMLGIIQKTAVIQSGRLAFLQDWQAHYSQLIADVTLFTGTTSFAALAKSGDEEINSQRTTDRTETNAKNNQYIETMKTRRQTIADESKQFQSNVGQSNDAASEQANMATAILQQLSGILAVIFR